MYAKVLAVAAVTLLATSPAFAASKKHAAADTVPAGWENSAPIPYSELAAADAKINGTGGAAKHKAKKHMAKKTASASASASATTTAGADGGAAK